MNLKSVILVVLFLAFSTVLARLDKDFINAIQRGANAELTVRVVDDAKHPVGDAKLRVRFDSAFKASGKFDFLMSIQAVVTLTRSCAVSLKARTSFRCREKFFKNSSTSLEKSGI